MNPLQEDDEHHDAPDHHSSNTQLCDNPTQGHPEGPESGSVVPSGDVVHIYYNNGQIVPRDDLCQHQSRLSQSDWQPPPSARSATRPTYEDNVMYGCGDLLNGPRVGKAIAESELLRISAGVEYRGNSHKMPEAGAAPAPGQQPPSENPPAPVNRTQNGAVFEANVPPVAHNYRWVGNNMEKNGQLHNGDNL